MKTEIRYICEICNHWYSDAAQAEECEARGNPEAPQTGLMWTESKGGFYGPLLAFAVAKTVIRNGHYQDVLLWACRDTGMGDSLGDKFCGGSGFNDDPAYLQFRRKWLDLAPFQRLAKWMKKNGSNRSCAMAVKLSPLNRVSSGRRRSPDDGRCRKHPEKLAIQRVLFR